MKAPSVREGSKENGTAAKISLVSIAVRRLGTDSIESDPNTVESVPLSSNWERLNFPQVTEEH